MGRPSACSPTNVDDLVVLALFFVASGRCGQMRDQATSAARPDQWRGRHGARGSSVACTGPSARCRVMRLHEPRRSPEQAPATAATGSAGRVGTRGSARDRPDGRDRVARLSTERVALEQTRTPATTPPGDHGAPGRRAGPVRRAPEARDPARRKAGPACPSRCCESSRPTPPFAAEPAPDTMGTVPTDHAPDYELREGSSLFGPGCHRMAGAATTQHSAR